MEKSLDKKIANILANPNTNDFIIADAKDADMAFGLAAPGKSPEHHANEAKFRTLSEYRDIMRSVIQQGLVDILLMSASSNELLTMQEKLFANSAITPAARANDTTDVWVAMGGQYPTQPSRPFRSATIDHIMCGKAACETNEPVIGADLGLYSMTFNNDVQLDQLHVEAYKQFRIEAEQKGFRHFLEVFNPNALRAEIGDVGRFLNDMITRVLAGVTQKGRPLFLKIPYHGPEAMESLAAYDRSLIPGILGGSSGTTLDAFFQLWEAKKYGARVALYGRMINNSEHQLAFIQHLRWLADGEIMPEEAVKSYHGALQQAGISPYRSLQDDLVLTLRSANYGGGDKKKAMVTKSVATGSSASDGSKSANSIDTSGEPDFTKMTSAEKIAWNRARWSRMLD